MADSSLSVKITADVSSLVTQKAVAKAELSDLNATVKDLATQFVAASDDMKASLNPQLETAAADAETARLHLAALNAELKATVHPEVTGFFGQLHESVRVTGESMETLHARLAVFSQAASAFSELVIAGLALDTVAEKINHVAETGEQMLKLSEETGLTTQQLSGLRVMAEQTGTDFDSFTKLLTKLPSTMQEAAIDPAGKAGEAFAAMGVKVTGTNGQLRPMGEVLDEVSAKLASYADGTDKTALETDIFGSKIGASLIPMLNQLGQVGLQGAIEKSNELNQTWTTQSAEAAEQFEQDMGRAKLAVEGITDSIIRELLPALDAMNNLMAPTLDSQINNLSERINQLGMRASTGMREQLAALEAQKKQLDDSMAQQSASVGGAAAGSVAAPTVSSSASDDSMAQQTAALDKQNQLIEQNASSTKEANQEKLQNTVQFWQGVLAAGNLSAKQELTAQTDLSKAETALRANQLAGDTSAAKSAATEQTQIAADAAAAAKQITASEYDMKVSNWDAEVATGKMSKAQEIQDEIAAQNQIYAIELSTAEKIAQLAVAGTAAKAKALDDVQVMTAQHDAEIARMNSELVTQQVDDAKRLADQQKQAADATAQAWQRAFQPISNAFSTSVNGIIQGTETMRQAEVKAAQSIVLAFADAAAKRLVSFAASEAMILARGVMTEAGLTAATAGGEATRLAIKSSADATGKAADVAMGTAQINASAMKAAAGAYSAVAGIPYVGPVLAPVAAATAYAGVMAYDVLSAEGGMMIGGGENPLVQLHEREMVLPSHIAQPLQSALGGEGFGGGDVTNHFNFHARGGRGGSSAEDMLSTLNDAVRSGSLQKYPAIARMMRRGG